MPRRAAAMGGARRDAKKWIFDNLAGICHQHATTAEALLITTAGVWTGGNVIGHFADVDCRPEQAR
ncbi:hypothetical protein [Actinomadura geliboluensis]|uniref:Uncharacterized protein n=1 Tax=Actinomadura geliboluensis TaxID=882440 RepID=A0A5S4GKK7_9ACTN|nr:hypothetical protein [Actinomadura geliboluensis]TMR33417.1 hypothetical protein ETD96_27460 [Actinomadura geliboluensis]